MGRGKSLDNESCLDHLKVCTTPLPPCANKPLTDHVALWKEHKMQVSNSPKEVKVEEKGSVSLR